MPVGAESLNAFEAGFKWDSANGKLRLNGAAFFNVWEDQQVFAVTNGIPALTNVPESQLYGAELELLWAPADSWLIAGNVGVLESEITDDGDLVGIDEGHGLRNNPPFSLTGSVRRDFEFANGNALDVFLKFRYQSEMIDNLNDIQAEIGGVTLRQDDMHTHDAQFEVDVRATYTFGDDAQYSLALWGENLTGEQYCYDIGLIDNIDNAAANALATTNQCSPNDGEALFGITGRVDF